MRYVLVFVRNVAVIALFVVTVAVGMVTSLVVANGPIAYPGSSVANFMVSPAHTWIVSTVTGQTYVQYATWTELKPESEGGNETIYGDVTLMPAGSIDVVYAS
jgi:hypothetical protein